MDTWMVDRYDDDEIAPHLVQRRWSAAVAAAKALQDECNLLQEVMRLAERAWRDACCRMTTVRVLRDELARILQEELAIRPRGMLAA